MCVHARLSFATFIMPRRRRLSTCNSWQFTEGVEAEWYLVRHNEAKLQFKQGSATSFMVCTGMHSEASPRCGFGSNNKWIPSHGVLGCEVATTRAGEGGRGRRRGWCVMRRCPRPHLTQRLTTRAMTLCQWNYLRRFLQHLSIRIDPWPQASKSGLILGFSGFISYLLGWEIFSRGEDN